MKPETASVAAKPDTNSQATKAGPSRQPEASVSGAKPVVPPRKSGGASTIGAGILGGVVGVALAFGLQAAGLFSSNNRTEMLAPEVSSADLDTLRAEIETLRQQAQAPAADPAIAGLSERLDALAGTVAALPEPAQGGSEAGLSELGARISALESSVSGIGDNSQAVADLDRKVAALEQAESTRATATQAVEQKQAALDDRIGALEGRIGQLGESIEGQPQMALAIAATALKAAIDRGGAFATELDTYAAVAPDAAALEPLRPFATGGIATRAEIETGASAAATAIADASRPVDPSAGVVDRLLSSAQSLVSVRPVGTVEGDGPAAIAARMEAAILSGNYPAAIAEYEKLPEAAKAVAADFIVRVRAREQADRIMETAMAAALRPAPAVNGGQP